MTRIRYNEYGDPIRTAPPKPGPLAYIITAAVLLAFIVGAIALGRATFMSYSTQPNNVALAYNDGPIANRTYDKLIPPGTREAQGFGDVAFSYPTDQRDWDFAGVQERSDANPLRIVVKGIGGQGSAEIHQPGIVRFILDTDEETLKGFHEQLGLRYGAYANEEGEMGEGWQSIVLPKYLETPLRRTMQEVAAEKQYTVDALYLQPALRTEWANLTLERLPNAVKAEVDSRMQFFGGFTLDLGQPPVLPDGIRQNLDAEQTALSDARRQQTEAKAKADAITANAQAEVTRAESEARIAAAEAAKRTAEANGYGGFDERNKARAIENGLNPYQPTIVAPGAPAPR